MNGNQHGLTLINSSPSASGMMRYFINVNVIYILIPETFIWITFTATGLGLSPAHKSFLLITIIGYLFIFKPYVHLKVFGLALALSVSTLFTLAAGNHHSFLESLEDITRLLLVFATFYFFKHVASEGRSKLKFFKSLVWVSFAVIATNLLLGAAGFGNDQRGLGIGTRGFFNAGNDISTITCIIAAFVLSEKYEKGWKTLLFYLAVFLYFGYLLNTKAFIAGLVIVIAILPIYGETKRFMRVKVFYRLAIFIFTFPILLALSIYLLNLIDFWDPYFAFIDQFENDSWITFILSRRDQNLLEALNFTQSNFNLFHYFFGYSPGAFLENVPMRAEIDPFEIFFYFGIVGVVVVYGWFLKAIFVSFNAGLQQRTALFPYQRGLFAANVFLFLQSLTSGHVFMSVLVCIYLGTLNAISFLKDD